MKKLFSVLLLGVVIFAPLTACSSSPESPDPVDPPAETSEEGSDESTDPNETTP